MPNSEDEIKRLQRIRDQQLAARVPTAKRDRHFREYRARHGGKRRPMTLKEMYEVFDHRWRGLAIGMLLGIIVWMVIPFIAVTPWRNVIGLAAIFLLGLVGFVIGMSFDWRDDLRKF